MSDGTRSPWTILKESAIVGLVTVAVAYVVYKLNKWYMNKALDVYGVLFLTGFFIHLGFEVTGLNRYYCEDIWPKSHRSCTKTEATFT